jgi:glycosyltransferase involved in cell wall biosynthesis
VRAGLAAADHVVAPSAAMLEALADCHGPMRAPASVIPNGLPPPAHPVGRKRDVVLAAGRIWDAAKNIATLVTAARGLPWPVWIAGDRAPGQGGAAPLGGVETLGRLEAGAMAQAYAAAAVFAAPARYEPFGLSILEAAQHGCALVLGDIPSLRENWDGAALFVDPDDAETLAALLSGLAANAPARAELGARARARAACFPLARTCEATLNLYEQLLQKESRVCAS